MVNEQRLIDANKLKDRFKHRLDWLQLDVHDEYTKGLYHGCDYDMTLINEQPTVDATEVVRCKDCKHCDIFENWNKREYFGCCHIPSEICEVEPEHFCSYGERRGKDAVD